MVKKIFAALFSILFLTIGLIILPKPEKEKNNMAETWMLNETIDLTTSQSWDINFTSNNQSFTKIDILSRGAQRELRYLPNVDDKQVVCDYPSGWYNEAYRTIAFDAAPTGTLLTWLQANGTKQETDTSKKLTKLRYKVSDVCQLFDKDKYFATRTAHGVVFTNNGDGSFTINGTCDSDADADTPLFLQENYNVKFDLYSIEGHKYLLIPLPQAFSYSTLRFIFGSQATPYYETSDTYKIFTATKTGTYPCYAIYRVGKGTTINNLTVKPQLFDLTEMYGAGNEPTTLAEFRQKYPNDLYSYSPLCWYSLNKTRYMSNQYGNIDLSTLEWSKEGLNFVSTPLSNIKIPASDVAANMICSKYRSVPINDSFVEGDFAINLLGSLYVRDTEYGDIMSFKESLKNLILTYELATDNSGGYLPLNKGVKL